MYGKLFQIKYMRLILNLKQSVEKHALLKKIVIFLLEYHNPPLTTTALDLSLRAT
jgi:hypothetical protein